MTTLGIGKSLKVKGSPNTWKGFWIVLGPFDDIFFIYPPIRLLWCYWIGPTFVAMTGLFEYGTLTILKK